MAAARTTVAGDDAVTDDRDRARRTGGGRGSTGRVPGARLPPGAPQVPHAGRLACPCHAVHGGLANYPTRRVVAASNDNPAPLHLDQGPPPSSPPTTARQDTNCAGHGAHEIRACIPQDGDSVSWWDRPPRGASRGWTSRTRAVTAVTSHARRGVAGRWTPACTWRKILDGRV